MTWLRRARFVAAPWIIVALGLAAGACSAPSLPGSSANAGVPRCVALVARAISDPRLPVTGAWDCLGATMQADGSAAGYSGDAGLQKLAAARGHATARYVGMSEGVAYVYELSGGTVKPVTVIMYVDSSGKVLRVDQDQA